jgi:tetratricopeptide (TPR) repeat protein
MRFVFFIIAVAMSLQSIKAQHAIAHLRSQLELGSESGLALADSCIRTHHFEDSAYYYKSLLLLKLGKIQSAKKEIELTKKKFPAFYLTQYAEALYYFQMEDYGRCGDKLNAVLKVDPKNTKCYFNRALVSGLLDDYKGAIEDLDQCLILDPHNANFAYARAYWKEMKSQYAEAIMDYEMALSLNAKLFDAYIGIANCYRIQKNLPEACKAIDRAEAAGSQMALDLRQSYCH